MILTATPTRHGAWGEVVDLDTGLPVPRTHTLEKGGSVVRQPDGSLLLTGVIRFVERQYGKDVERRAKGRFKLIPAAPRTAGVLLGSPTCSRCGSWLTLAGDDLCPRCKAADRGQRHRFVVERLDSPLLDHPCEVKYCGRLAEVMVSDEVLVSCAPQKVRLQPHRTHSRVHTLHYERAMCVARHFYCHRHHRPPRILDDRGEVVEVLEPVLK